jgi:hypothetical protein
MIKVELREISGAAMAFLFAFTLMAVYYVRRTETVFSVCESVSVRDSTLLVMSATARLLGHCRFPALGNLLQATVLPLSSSAMWSRRMPNPGAPSI